MAGPEAQIRNRYRTAAHKLGYVVLVLHGSAYSGPGRADTLTLAAGKWIAIEFKAATGLRPTQLGFLRQVRAAGGYSFVARRSDLALRAVAHIVNGRTPYMPDQMEVDDLAWLDDLAAVDVLNGDSSSTPVPDRPSETPPPLSLEDDPSLNRAIDEATRILAGEPPKRGRRPKTTPADVNAVLSANLPLRGVDAGDLSDVMRLLIDMIGQLTFEVQALKSELQRVNDREVEAE